MKIRKAVIPAAGLGTRFLPATKAQAKEMLPIVDKPTIQYIVEEAVASGIEEILVIVGRGKRSIEHHFTKSHQLETMLVKQQKLDKLEEVQQIQRLVKIYYLYQHEPNGLGDAVLAAKEFIGNEPFAVLLGDDLVRSDTPCLQQLTKAFEYMNSSIVAVKKVAEKDVSKYGIIKSKGMMMAPRILPVESLVEKPKLEEAPSQYAIMGRYVLRPEIFTILEKTPIGAGNELQLTDAINLLVQEQAVFAYEFEGERYDIGDKLGFIQATVDFALQRDELRDDVLSFLKKRVKEDQPQESEPM
ncbi:UTP--glucose-1-phosphate uridylyltransferase GalU [Mesobacillus maritimus]|uniref:UTP--glucose-1-phosphate uridylyltransferase GalU n=1 Tax=Mesobacillus maritimus TaxID=1643336 RepID=UPI00203AAB3F|nr:UTP--glucose-1-phosphate uridylyltransferase GalU [Mesobacillus maritimus]MCM3585296.1 UTP--glucose-1-phosphate uridylyltransferase GalU [Mesobacillus maritimus]